MYMLLTLVYSTYGIATKNLIFFFRTSLAQNAKYFRRKGIGLLLPGSSHLQRGRFNPQSQLFGQMKIFLSMYNFFKKVKIAIFSRNGVFLHFSSPQHFPPKMLQKCHGRLGKRKKAQFREKVANLTLKCTFEGSKVLAAGGLTLENRKNLCHFTKPPISALCEKWPFFLTQNDAFYRKLDFFRA